jgi:ketosteroid isomerase-like protein
MELDRRHLALAGALALGASALLRGTQTAAAAGADETAVGEAVEALRKAIFDADKAKLAALTADQLSYGHSSAVVQSKSEFIDGVLNRKATVKTLTFPDLVIAVTGDAAVTRHRYLSDTEQDGKTSNTTIGVLAVWQKQGDAWKLLARQGFKLG